MYGLGNKHFILENDSVQIQPDLDFDFEDGICKGFEESAILCGGYSFSAGSDYAKNAGFILVILKPCPGHNLTIGTLKGFIEG